jgi:tRNA (mo5U34)-methyltransferase
MMALETARSLQDQVSWYHRFESMPGLMTPGRSDMNAFHALNALGVQSDLTGLSAADIGAWDGPITFELERRGARAIAVDIQDPDRVGFNIAKKILESNAEHYRRSVYDLPTPELNNLDLIIFHGVFYHLRHPLLAFDRINSTLKPGGKMFFEGEAFLHYAEKLDGTPQSDLEAFANSGIPLCLSYPNRYKGSENWFIPNIACFRSWMEATGFQIEHIETFTDQGAQRLYGSAIKIREGNSLTEHAIY